MSDTRLGRFVKDALDKVLEVPLKTKVYTGLRINGVADCEDLEGVLFSYM